MALVAARLVPSVRFGKLVSAHENKSPERATQRSQESFTSLCPTFYDLHWSSTKKGTATHRRLGSCDVVPTVTIHTEQNYQKNPLELSSVVSRMESVRCSTAVTCMRCVWDCKRTSHELMLNKAVNNLKLFNIGRRPWRFRQRSFQLAEQWRQHGFWWKTSHVLWKGTGMVDQLCVEQHTHFSAYSFSVASLSVVLLRCHFCSVGC